MLAGRHVRVDHRVPLALGRPGAVAGEGRHPADRGRARQPGEVHRGGVAAQVQRRAFDQGVQLRDVERAGEHPPGRERQGAQQRVERALLAPLAGARDRQPQLAPLLAQAEQQLDELRRRQLLAAALGERAQVDVLRRRRLGSQQRDQRRAGQQLERGRGGADAGLLQAAPALQVHRLLAERGFDQVGAEPAPGEPRPDRPGAAHEAPLRAAQPGSGAGVVRAHEVDGDVEALGAQRPGRAHDAAQTQRAAVAPIGPDPVDPGREAEQARVLAAHQAVQLGVRVGLAHRRHRRHGMHQIAEAGHLDDQDLPRRRGLDREFGRCGAKGGRVHRVDRVDRRLLDERAAEPPEFAEPLQSRSAGVGCRGRRGRRRLRDAGPRDHLARRVRRRLARRNVRQAVRDALVAVDAGLLLVGQVGRVHVLRAHALAREVHRLVVVAVAALERVVGLEARPFVLRELEALVAELLLRVDGAEDLAPDLLGGLHLAGDLVGPVVRHVAVGADRRARRSGWCSGWSSSARRTRCRASRGSRCRTSRCWSPPSPC